MAVIKDPSSKRFVYSKSSSKSNFTPEVDHRCPGCGSPIYDKKPVCGKCFKEGKYPKARWRRNQ